MQIRRWREEHGGRRWDCRRLLVDGLELPGVEAVLAALERPDKVLRDDARSRVLCFDGFPGASPAQAAQQLLKGPWVAKRPRWKDERLWNRLTTLYRPGEAAQVFERSLQLQEIGFPAAQVLLLLERRSRGMIAESWLVYRYLEGVPAGHEDGDRVIELLQLLHAAGWRHRDPHLANWIRTKEDLAALDLNPRRLRCWAPDAAYDFVLLRNCDPALEDRMPLSGSPAWRLALLRNGLVQGWRAVKRKLRGKNRPG